ncbi:MAG: S8 family serine peptidase [Deltaproteobacteria bacterium]|nr:S8 family serine peptidase [Deltaproteobacteria bacterium]
MVIRKNVRQFVWAFAFLFFNMSCDSPSGAPDKGSLLLSLKVLSDDGSPIAGFDHLEFKISRIEVVHRSDLTESAVEQTLPVSDVLQTLTITPTNEPINVGQFEIPVGFVEQIRLITSEEISPSVSVSISGDSSAMKLPSGDQTGLKINPADKTPFEIKKDEVTAVRATFDPQKNTIRNKGQGYILKPTLEAVALLATDITGGLKPNVVAVRFKPGISLARVEEINAEIGAVILKAIPELNAYKMKVPNSMSIIDGIHFYEGKLETDRTAPVFFMGVAQAAGVPNEGTPAHQTIINAPNLWTRLENADGVVNGTVGNRDIIVAVIDAGFDLDHPDLIPNWYINAAEIPPALGIVDADGDGVMTFIDLNDAANSAQCPVGANANAPFNICDPLDIINDPNWADGADTDGNGFVDDLVGSDFTGAGDNNPNSANAHGTMVTGIIGAVGDNLAGGANVLNVDPALDPTGAGIFTVTGGIAGMSWRVRILPLRVQTMVAGAAPDDADDFDVQQALVYARNQGADIVNISLATLSFENTAPAHPTATCSGAIFDGLGKNFGDVRNRANNFYNFNIGNMLVVLAAGNCNVNVPATSMIVVPQIPLQTNHPNQVIITAATDTTITAGNPNPALTGFSSRGVGYADIAAPGLGWLTLDFGGGTATVDGTSFASPTVAGASAVILDRNPALIGNGPGLRTAVLDAASATVNLADITPVPLLPLTPASGNGRFLDLATVP